MNRHSGAASKLIARNPEVHVAVGVIRDTSGRVLLAKRPDHVHQGGLWEFPGGKIESGESVAQALARELREELAIDVLSCSPLLVVAHDYSDKRVVLDVWQVSHFDGEAVGREGQPLRWVAISELGDMDIPEANLAITAHLQGGNSPA